MSNVFNTDPKARAAATRYAEMDLGWKVHAVKRVQPIPDGWVVYLVVSGPDEDLDPTHPWLRLFVHTVYGPEEIGAGRAVLLESLSEPPATTEWPRVWLLTSGDLDLTRDQSPEDNLEDRLHAGRLFVSLLDARRAAERECAATYSVVDEDGQEAPASLTWTPTEDGWRGTIGEHYGAAVWLVREVVVR